MDSFESSEPLLLSMIDHPNKQSQRFRRLRNAFDVIASIYILVTLPMLILQSVWRMPQPHCTLQTSRMC